MRLWLDAQLSPTLVTAKDREIFAAVQDPGAVVMTEDCDFADLVERLGPPPHVIWITCGNTSKQDLKGILSATRPQALPLIEAREPLVEIRDAGPPEPVS